MIGIYTVFEKMKYAKKSILKNKALLGELQFSNDLFLQDVKEYMDILRKHSAIFTEKQIQELEFNSEDLED